MSGSLFQGSPQTATSYVTSSAETPKWMQDAIYNQVQLATNVANRPYQAYNMPTVAELSPLQQQAYSQVQKNVGAWQPTYNEAVSGTSAVTKAPGAAAAASPFVQQAGGLNQITAAQPYMAQQSGLLGGLDYNRPATTLAPFVGSALETSGINAARPMLNAGAGMISEAGTAKTADQLRADQAEYLRKELVDINLNKGQGYFDRSGALDVYGAGKAALDKAYQQNIVGAAQPLIGKAETTTAQSLAERALTAADPFLKSAGQTSASQVGQYMSPYQQGVLDVIAKQGARNLSEVLLPQVSDAFIKAGQFGSNRMGEFGRRALRDTQESILNQQAQAAQQGYGQSLSAAQADLARQAQLAGTVGSISGADLSRILQGGAQYGNLGQTMGQLTAQQMAQLTNLGQTQGQLTSQQMQNLANLGQMQTVAGQAQQQFGLNAAQAAQAAAQADLARQLSAGSQLAQVGQMTGQLTNAQQQAILQAGQALTGAQQQGIAQSLQGAGMLGQQAQLAGSLTAGQQGVLGNLAQISANTTGADLQRQLTGNAQLANMAQQGQALRTADVAALEGAGAAQQAQMQAQLNAARQQFEMAQNYPKQQLDWLSTQVRGMAPLSPPVTTQTGQTSGATYGPSPLSQLATGMYLYKGASSI